MPILYLVNVGFFLRAWPDVIPDHLSFFISRFPKCSRDDSTFDLQCRFHGAPHFDP